jgi:hypothetical protein
MFFSCGISGYESSEDLKFVISNRTKQLHVQSYRDYNLVCDSRVNDASVKTTGGEYTLDCRAAPTVAYPRTHLGYVPGAVIPYFAEVCLVASPAVSTNITHVEMTSSHYKRRAIELLGKHAARKLFVVTGALVGAGLGGLAVLGSLAMSSAALWIANGANERIDTVEERLFDIHDMLGTEADINTELVNSVGNVINANNVTNEMVTSLQLEVANLYEVSKNTTNMLLNNMQTMKENTDENIKQLMEDTNRKFKATIEYVKAYIDNNTRVQMQYSAWVQHQISAINRAVLVHDSQIHELAHRNKLRAALTSTVRTVIDQMKTDDYIPFLTTADSEFMSSWWDNRNRGPGGWVKTVGNWGIHYATSENALHSMNVTLHCDIEKLEGYVPPNPSLDQIIILLTGDNDACTFDVDYIQCYLQARKEWNEQSNTELLFTDWTATAPMTNAIVGGCMDTKKTKLRIPDVELKTQFGGDRNISLHTFIARLNSYIFVPVQTGAQLSAFNRSDSKLPQTVAISSSVGVYATYISNNRVYDGPKPIWEYIKNTVYGRTSLIGKLSRLWELSFMQFSETITQYNDDFFGRIPTTVTQTHRGLTQLPDGTTGDCWVATILGIKDNTAWVPVYQLGTPYVSHKHTLKDSTNNIATFHVPISDEQDWEGLPAVGSIYFRSGSSSSIFNTLYNQHPHLIKGSAYDKKDTLLYLLAPPVIDGVSPRKIGNADYWFVDNPDTPFNAHHASRSLHTSKRSLDVDNDSKCNALDMSEPGSVCASFTNWRERLSQMDSHMCGDEYSCFEKRSWGSSKIVRMYEGGAVQLLVDDNCPTVTIETGPVGVPAKLRLMFALPKTVSADDHSVPAPAPNPRVTVEWLVCSTNMEYTCSPPDYSFRFKQPIQLEYGVAVVAELWDAIPLSFNIGSMELKGSEISVIIINTESMVECYSGVISNVTGSSNASAVHQQQKTNGRVTSIVSNYMQRGSLSGSGNAGVFNRSKQALQTLGLYPNEEDLPSETNSNMDIAVLNELKRIDGDTLSTLSVLSDVTDDELRDSRSVIDRAYTMITPREEMERINAEFDSYLNDAQNSMSAVDKLLLIQQLKLAKFEKELLDMKSSRTGSDWGDFPSSLFGTYMDWMRPVIVACICIVVLQCCKGCR